MNHSTQLVHRAKAEIFKNKDQVEVLAAVEVQQCALTAALLNKNKKSARQALGEPRVVVISGQWQPNSTKIKLGLFPCSTVSGRLQVKRAYALKGLKKITAVINDSATQVFAVGLTFGNSGRETDLTFQARNEITLFQLLGPLWYYITKFKQSDRGVPELIGLPERRRDILQQITDWNARYIDQSIEQRLINQNCGTDDCNDCHDDDPSGEPAEEEEKDEDENSSTALLISSKEEKDLSQLLTRSEYESTDVADFQARLQQELLSLEAANVQTILETTTKVAKVRDSLNDALALLEDVNENLATFDTKLLVMREDIEAIESRNNRLELQTRNNGKLLEALDRLLDKMQLSSETEKRLKSWSFASRNRESMIEAGWELYDHIHSLGESVKASKDTSGFGNYGIANMTAVGDQRQRFASLTKTYVEQASEYIGVELMNQTTKHLQMALARQERNGSMSMPDHGPLHRDFDELTSLVHVLRTTKPAVIKQISMQYTEAVNILLRKELRLYTSEIRKQAGSGAGNSDVWLLTGQTRKKEDFAAAQEGPHDKKMSLRSNLSGIVGGGGDSPKKAKDVSLPGTSISEYWTQLLQDWMPMLLNELDHCADFLNFKEDDIAYTQDIHTTVEGMHQHKPEHHHPHHHDHEHNEGEHHENVHGLNNGHTNGNTTWGSLKTARMSTIGAVALDALLANISTDFFTIVDLVGKQNQLQAIPMLSITLKWRAKVKSLPLAAPLYVLLHQCAERLTTSFKQCISDMVLALERFEARFTLKDGLKQIHVLPFVSHFPRVVEHLTELVQTALALKPSQKPMHQPDDLEDEEDAAGFLEADEEYMAEEEEDLFPETSMLVEEFGNFRAGVRSTLGRTSYTIRGPLAHKGLGRNSANTGDNRLQRGSARPRRSLHIDRPILEGPSLTRESDATLRQLTEAELPDHIPDLRLIQSVKDAVDPAYAVLSRALFAVIEAIGQKDAKHGERVKMENLFAFAELLKGPAEKNLILDYFVREASDQGHEALEAYIQQQMEYARVWRLVDFSQGVDQMLLQVGEEEVTFQIGFRLADFQAMIAATVTSGLQKRLTVIKARIAKHMDRDQTLIDMVWSKLQSIFKDCYSRLYNEAETLYPQTVLPLTPADLGQIFASIDGQNSNA